MKFQATELLPLFIYAILLNTWSLKVIENITMLYAMKIIPNW